MAVLSGEVFLRRRYLDEAAIGTPAHRRRFPLPFARRRLPAFLRRALPAPGIFIFDEPESALSPVAPDGIPELMRRMDTSGNCQVIMATHSPMLMAYPNARLLRLTKYGLDPVTVKPDRSLQDHAGVCDDPAGFVEAVIEE